MQPAVPVSGVFQTCTNPLSYPATPYCIESHCLNGIEEFRASVRLISNPDAEFAHGPQAGCNHRSWIIDAYMGGGERYIGHFQILSKIRLKTKSRTDRIDSRG